MKRAPIITLIVIFSFLITSCNTTAPRFPAGTIVDLSHAYDEETIFWPTAEGFRLEKDFAGVTEKGYYYAANRFSTAEHGGTHIDAPVHFAEAGRAVDEIPLEQLIGHAVVVDVARQCESNSDYQISVVDFRA